MRSLVIKYYSDYVKMIFTHTKGKSLLASEESLCCRCNPSLLCVINAVLRRCLYAFAASFHLYKMYSICTRRDDVYFKVSDSIVALQNRVPFISKQSASKIFSLFSGYLSFISAILHSPSTFSNVAIFFFVCSHPSLMV